ncbi:hypothetical protein Airi02_061040 [Actinoallomurus iriomotensis]|uniref:Uncharacterized protein n=1 Tax=Actinoallomurus iriomotensis TaxID=478107 RepID=A0A9W6W1R0_9ACTN|nr:hypothetical protein Airi02_061040 [Actinoallomurus iriomotensis]
MGVRIPPAAQVKGLLRSRGRPFLTTVEPLIATAVSFPRRHPYRRRSARLSDPNQVSGRRLREDLQPGAFGAPGAVGHLWVGAGAVLSLRLFSSGRSGRC